MTAATVDTPLLRIAYERAGRGEPVLLLHGWPDDARTWGAVSERLVRANHEVIAPYLRGFGDTRFHDAATPRSGQMTAMAQDAIDLLDALGIGRVVLVGHDWGARAAYIVAALWPQRVSRLIALSVGYETRMPSGDAVDYAQAHAYWYQWFFHTERGREALQQNRRVLCRYLWRTWAPHHTFDDATFDATAASWDNPDWVDITVHSYRYRWRAAELDRRYDALESAIATLPKITVPTRVIHGDADGATFPAMSANKDHLFSAGHERITLPHVGHFPQREDPQTVAAAILRVGADAR